MTIKEYAESKAVSTGAIYKAVSRSGHSMKDLTDRKGQITGKGLSILREIYPDDQEPDQEPLSDSLKDQQPEDSVLEDLRERLSEAERARDRAEELLQIEKDLRIKAEGQAEKWERLYLELQDKSAQERARDSEDQRELRVIAAQAQEIIKHFSMNPIRRLFSGKKKEKPAQTVNGNGQVN